MNYKKLLKRIEMLQRDLMDIEDYSEEVYQAFEQLIDTLDEELDEELEY